MKESTTCRWNKRVPNDRGRINIEQNNHWLLECNTIEKHSKEVFEVSGQGFFSQVTTKSVQVENRNIVQKKS